MPVHEFPAGEHHDVVINVTDEDLSVRGEGDQTILVNPKIIRRYIHGGVRPPKTLLADFTCITEGRPFSIIDQEWRGITSTVDPTLTMRNVDVHPWHGDHYSYAMHPIRIYGAWHPHIQNSLVRGRFNAPNFNDTSLAGIQLENCVSVNCDHVTVYFCRAGIKGPSGTRVEGLRLTNSDVVWCRHGLALVGSPGHWPLQVAVQGSHFSVQKVAVSLGQVKDASISNSYMMRTPETEGGDNVIFVHAHSGSQYLRVHDNFFDNTAGRTPEKCYGVVFQNGVVHSQVHHNQGNHLIVGAWDQTRHPTNHLETFTGNVTHPIHPDNA